MLAELAEYRDTDTSEHMLWVARLAPRSGRYAEEWERSTTIRVTALPTTFGPKTRSLRSICRAEARLPRVGQAS